MTFRKRVLAHDQVLAGTFLNLGSALTSEIVGLAGFDWVAIDLEHGAGSEMDALHQLQAIAHTGAAGLVRVESISGARIGHALDSGAAGVIVPQVRNASEAAAAVAACRYAGTRGVARFNRSWHWGEKREALTEADALITCCVQIERHEALADVDAIAATEGVDVLFVGPADLAHSLGIDGGPNHPDLLEAAREVSDAARTHGKAAGVLAGTVEQLKHYHELGFTFLGCAADSAFLMRSARATAESLHRLSGSSAAS